MGSPFRFESAIYFSAVRIACDCILTVGLLGHQQSLIFVNLDDLSFKHEMAHLVFFCNFLGDAECLAFALHLLNHLTVKDHLEPSCKAEICSDFYHFVIWVQGESFQGA